MALINKDGQYVSYECSALIAELKEDIEEFGENKKVMVWCRDTQGVTLFVNYDFILGESPVFKKELASNERLITMTMGELLPQLEKQNNIF
jgi:hypothetical protein